MSVVYTPTPHQPKGITDPSDGDNKPAASVTVGLQGLADGLAATATIPFNWQASASTTHNLKRGNFSKKDQAWFAVGDGGNDFLEVSYSGGRKWTDLAANLGSLLPCIDIAFDGSGNGVILTSGSTKVYKGTWSSYGSITWAMNTNLHHTVTDGRILYDSTHSKWVVIYRSGSSGIFVETSSDGVTWTVQTVTAAFSGYTGTLATPKIFCSPTGTMIAVFEDATPLIHIMRSADGGVTWTDVADITGSFSGTTMAVTYDPVYQVWYAVAAVTGTRKTDIVSSSNDGVTWSAVTTFASSDMALQEIVVLAAVLIGINDDGRIFFNQALGAAPWYFATTNTGTGTVGGMRLGDGQILVWNPNDKTSFSSLRYGGAGLQVA